MDPLNKLARAASGEKIRLSSGEKEREREASCGMQRLRNSFVRLLDAIRRDDKVMQELKFQSAIFHPRAAYVVS